MTEDYCVKFKKIREEKGFTQSQVANYLGISRQAISQWERGVTYPDMDNIVLLCELYQVSANDLIPSQKNIDIKEEQTATENRTKESEDTNLRSAIENLSLLVVLALTSQIAFLGMIMPVLVVRTAIKMQFPIRELHFY